MDNKNQTVKFIWRITCAHVIAYFIAGSTAMAFMNYKELFATDAMSLLMKTTTEPIVALGGTFLQLFRGIIIALIIFPLRKAFFEDKHGYMKLGLIVLGFSFISTIGPAPGSFEGFIYTTIPISYQLLGYPETLLYILLFIGIINITSRFDKFKIVKILPSVLVCMIALLGVMAFMGYLYS